MRIEFLSLKENIGFARSCCKAFLVGLDFKMSYLNEVKCIVSEAVTNAIIHGYQGREDEIVTLEMSYDEDEIYIGVFDSGVGIIDIELAKTPLYSTSKSERSGLGFTIMEVFSDSLRVESEPERGTKVYISKKVE